MTGPYSWWLDRLNRQAAKAWGLTEAELRHELDESQRAQDALAAGDLDEADTLATALMAKVADKAPFHGSHDEYEAHLILGHVCLHRGDVDAAERHLLAAARIDDPDPALRTFGPDMSLAQALLRHGRTHAVIEYLDLCSALWKMWSFGRLKRWRTEVQEGRMPDFTPNLYGGECRYVPGDADEGHRRLTRGIVAAALLLAAGWVGLRLGRSRKRARVGP